MHVGAAVAAPADKTVAPTRIAAAAIDNLFSRIPTPCRRECADSVSAAQYRATTARNPGDYTYALFVVVKDN